MTDFSLLIGGKLVPGDATMEVINPATETVLTTCPRGSAAQMDQAVAAAKAAYPAWAARPITERREMLMKLADALESQQDEFARLLTQEQGKPLAEATAEIIYSTVFIRQLAAQDLPVKVIEDSATTRIEQHRMPLGVVGAIIPWNFPVLIICFKIPCALLAGNTVVIKPAPTTPLTALKLGELAAGIFPAGVVNIVTDMNDLGGQLTTHPDVAKVSFTGSTETGRKVMASAANTLKRLTLELGGNDAAIVLPGADPETVAPGIFGGAFMNAGQVCLAIKRAYVHDSIYDDVVERLAKLANDAVVGDGLQQGTTIGPLQNKMQYEKVKGFLDDARKDGRIVAGGQPVDGAGYFITPTIVADIDDNSRLVAEEQFGPILPVVRYTDPEDALTRANASPWGLGGSVWGDRDTARGIALRMESGTAWVNKHLDFGPHAPFGGAKQSGIGVEFAEEGLHEFTQIHVVNEAV
ncbi:MAG: aldehyde dehydrogenase family protein [Paracoccus sp. (in: a-proteobacteria)]|uniref:aldehyde dehydrogenase family protein n=1 Tax=Paracoccus sp. TaxID=267 RepID=UPI0026DEAC1A|nr:aldehyde dehydrogenase family protein [Paracoccus sp. (in: a-proteobacteria)]MDO5632039.1 aldehyde dehydrogenase family protein [Paracoccus sp. (in: a-proteobacteria)]